jgi:hypothetical protein
VIAEEQDDLATYIAQAQKLVDQDEPDSMVTAPAVDDVTRTDQDLGAFVQAKVHERSERESVRYRHALGDELVHGGRFEPSPTSEVKVRGVHEAEVGGSRCHSRKQYAYKGSKVGRSLSRVAWPVVTGSRAYAEGGDGRKVAKGTRNFGNKRIDKAIYATGWDGTVVITADRNGPTR